MKIVIVLAAFALFASASLICLSSPEDCPSRQIMVLSMDGCHAELLLKASHRGLDADVQLENAAFVLLRGKRVHYREVGQKDFTIRGLANDDVLILYCSSRKLREKQIRKALKHPDRHPYAIARVTGE